MEDIFLSYGFRLGAWLMLFGSALAMLVFYWTVRRREERIGLAQTYQELVQLCNQKQEERAQLDACILELDQRKANFALLASDDKNGSDQEELSEKEKHQAERNYLQREIEELKTEHEQRSAELKELSSTYVTLLRDVDHRRAQLESLTDQFRTVADDRIRAQEELKQATSEYMDIGVQIEERRTELVELERELGQHRARAERFRMDNPFLADHQERIAQQWNALEGQYQDVISKNRQHWQQLEDQFERLREQAQRSSTSLAL